MTSTTHGRSKTGLNEPSNGRKFIPIILMKRDEFLMETFKDQMLEYRNQLKKGIVQKAYKGLMDYIMHLRTHFKNTHPDIFIPGTFYPGYMDMTYFSLVPESLKQHNLKIAVVFLHEEFRFEAWLAAVNKQVQEKYWKMIRESGWDQYHLVSEVKGNDAILEHVLVGDPDFGDLDALTMQIEKGTLKFIEVVEDFLSAHKN